ncbi:MAG: DUF262 domain-containing protein [Rhodospirillales bacterium]|nr:DUF262 domain-containing protein [Rhodospirillales bacterium]
MPLAVESPVPEVSATHPGEEIEGLDPESQSWGDYPLDEVLIRQQNRTIHDVLRRIGKGGYVMDPEFQRDFIWPEDKQSKLVESVMMRIPLPVFYLAEDDEGRMVVVDGLQRISTFVRFLNGDLALRLPDRPDLDRKHFSDLPAVLQNRVEDANLIFYAIDSTVPERVRLDIFERVNSGVPLTRQQMRNSLYQGPGTSFVKEEAKTDVFLTATGRSLNSRTMRDREFVNRFCAFQTLDLSDYRGDMDAFLAESLRRMNHMEARHLSDLSLEFRRSLRNNSRLFGKHAFRKHGPQQERRGVLNASLWDVLSTGLSRYGEMQVAERAPAVREGLQDLFGDEEFNRAITYGPNDARKVRYRFATMERLLEETIGDPRA